MTSHWPRAAAAALFLAGARVAGQAPAGPSPPPSPSVWTSPRPIADSVDRVVERLEEEGKDPCRRAREEGRLCFPVTLETPARTYSVRESLGEAATRSVPTPPRPNTDMGPNRPGTQSTVVPLVSFDPGCVGKTIFKKLKGRNDTYYLYRLRDAQGERVEMYDRKLEPSTFQGELAFLGRFDGECDALAAYRRERNKLAPPEPKSVPPRPSPLPSPR